ncbi:MAG: hypothetical protein IJS08_11830 [Victivallales bacterium]|nr:hypothetical protein [Victivallales bacterium]
MAYGVTSNSDVDAGCAAGNDVLVGGSGDDLLHGGGGNDIFTFGRCALATRTYSMATFWRQARSATLPASVCLRRVVGVSWRPNLRRRNSSAPFRE